MARRMHKPDLRPSWKDPFLPCIRDYRFANGQRKIEVDPAYEQRYRAMLVQSSDNPDWRHDETYNARRRKP